ncbi:trypsin-like peptidase domain-containing protein [Nonomuraea muscovyensis]|uniref:Putative serine protease PepD n=1 Tax=Nonomuraea muscovyensis TaxID=1124761 RepID=A0A7X0BZA8_9ACTN|nr:trypsin-like peptidase domain-containing protein [Nonomuraea muscovyensis]MBB6344896.1 putative serine protease PepD [Nonomuraea muscovyensis]
MTDETRPDDGRRPSDFPDAQGRPDFRPAEERAERSGPAGGESAASGGWGDPSGRPGDTSVHGDHAGPAPYGPRDDRPGYAGGAPDRPGYGAGVPGQFGHGGPPDQPGHGGGAPDQLGHGGGAPDQPGDGGGAPDRPGHGRPEQPGHGSAEYSAVPGFASPDSTPYGVPSSGDMPPGGDTRAYESPFFGSSPGAPPYGGDAPPPPQQAFGMGPGWAPPPGPHSGQAVPIRRGPSTGLLIVLAVVIALAASLFGSVGTYLLTRSSDGTDPSYSLGPPPNGATNRAPDSVAGVAARVLPSVVSLEVGNGSGGDGATGSGFLIKDGYVVTNNHVVAMAARGGEIQIQFHNRKTTRGRIVGRDPGSDLAVVKPEETFGTPEITLGNSDQVVVGDPVIAVGSPLGLSGTVTTGIVSSLNRPVIAGDESGTSEEPAYISAIQTDAAINPGNSGGPLVNGKGEVVGVNSAIATLSRSLNSQSGSIGLGFAIPVNQARRVAQELVTDGKAKRPKIGIVLDRNYKGQGVRIASEPAEGRQPIDADGPAAKAGLKPGDVILEIDGLRLQDGNELIALIRSKSPGAKINIRFERAGQERTATLTVMADETPAPTPS